MTRAPAFQFYPGDFQGDENVAAMTFEEVGVYVHLMCYEWREGSLPADLGRLARMLKILPADLTRMWELIGPCFEEHPDLPDRLRHPRLEKERRKQAEYREKKIRAGQASGSARRAKTQESNTDRTVLEHTSNTPATEGATNANPSVFSLQSSTNGEQNTEAKASEAAPRAVTDANVAKVLAPLIREHFWLGNDPPPEVLRSEPGWTMGREISAAKQLAKAEKLSVDELADVVRHTRTVMDVPEHAGLSFLFLNKKGRRDRLNAVLHYVRTRKPADRNRVGDVLGRLVANG